MDSKQQEDEEYDKKLCSLQESVPFLLRVLEKLRNNNLSDPARQSQLEKMQKLYNLLTDKTRLKWETLLKCETVIKKLQKKMEQQPDLDLKTLGRVTPVNQKMTPLTVNITKEIVYDVDAGPESPPPQQEDDEKFMAQPVEIPTERRCSPPISISLHQKIHQIEEHSQQHWQPHKTHNRNNSQQHHQFNQRTKHHASSMSSSSSRENSLNNGRHDHNTSYNAHSSNERERGRDRDRDREQVRERRDESNGSRQRQSNTKQQPQQSHNSWQNRFNSNKIYSPEEVWDSCSYDNRQRSTQIPSLVDPDYDPSIIYNINRKPNTLQHSPNVFSRVGVKQHEPDASPASPPPFENFQINIKTKRIAKSTSAKRPKSYSSTSRSSPSNVETSPFTPDLLQSPPLSATDITQLLNENNSNSNSNLSDSLSISDIGTRRSTPIPIGGGVTDANVSTQQQSHLDMVRRKFAMLTKREAPLSCESPTPSNIPKNVVPSTTTSERLALKYNPHPRALATSTTPQSLNSTSHTVVNVLPTLRPNDPRLRAGSLISSDIPSTAQIPNVSGRQIGSLNSVSLSPNSPSPIYVNPISSAVRLTPAVATALPTSQIKPNDPRLRRSAYPLTKTNPPNTGGDSSEENWDTDDNNSESLKPRFPPSDHTFLSGEKLPPEHGINRYSHTSAPSLPIRRKSQCWDNTSPITNPTKCSPQEDWGNASSSNWYGTSMNLKLARPYNPKFPSGVASTATAINERFNPALNIQSERFKYLEAKKQKESSQPRTYGAYKEAKARAEAQVAARKDTEPIIVEKSSTEAVKQDAPKDKESKSTNSNPPRIANSTLDIMYRGSNLVHCELPKAIGGFKIPKKQVSTPQEGKDTKTEPPKTEKNVKTKTDETIFKTNPNSKGDAKKADLSISKKSAQPKPQRFCFSKPSNSGVSNDTETTHSLEDGDRKVLAEVAGSEKEEETPNSTAPKKPATQLKTNLALLQPPRILKRRCTMIDQASTPEVDKARLLKSNAMLFEDLQEQERKNKLAAAAKAQPNRRHGEICYEKTDDGCTVSTQNIITGKRRTRTTANFNEVQQGIAVFKHIKQTDEKKEAVTPPTAAKGGKKVENQSTPPAKSKPTPKSKIKAEPKSEEVVGKPIRKRRQTIVDTESKVKIKKEKTDPESEAAVAAVVPNVTNIFDTFIQKILHPDTNADELISKLHDILSEKEVETLLSVRSMMMKKHQESIESGAEKKTTNKVDTNDAKEVESPTSSQDKALTQVSTAIGAKSKAPRRNELDRLHEDIRDMFISEGVLTATGRRVCTFVEPGPATTSKSESDSLSKPHEVSNNSKLQKEQSPATTSVTSPAAPNKRRGRPKLPTTETPPPTRPPARRSMRKQEAKEETNVEEEELEKKVTDTVSSSETTEISLISDDSMNSSSNLEPLKQTTAAKHVESTRQPEENETNESLLKRKNGNSTEADKSKTEFKKRYRPCPKSKKPPSELLFQEDIADEHEDSDDVAIISPKKMETNTSDDSPAPKIKQEYDISVPVEAPTSMSRDKTLMNINPKWHCQSRYAHWCVICQQKINFLAMHYKKQHDEHYASRLAPSVLHHLRQENAPLSKVILKLKNKKYGPKPLFLHRCPFCLQYKRTVMTSWLEHFIAHTGEYCYECSECHHSVNKLNLIEKHLKEKCTRLGARYLHNDEVSLSTLLTEVKAHVCHLCNFIRLGQRSLERHYVEQHGYDAKNVNTDLSYTITLMDCSDVPVVETMEAIMQMETKLHKMHNTETIDLCKAAKAKGDKFDDEQNTSTPALPLNDIFEAEVEEAVIPIKIVAENAEEIIIESADVVKSQANAEAKPSADATESNSQNKKSIEKELEIVEVATENANDKADTSKADFSAKQKISAPPSSVFLSTTDDSNDGETSSTLLARKLLTVDDDRDLDSSPIKAGKSTISIAERLSQRFKEAEATTITTTSTISSPTTLPITTKVLARKLLTLDEGSIYENSNDVENSNSNSMIEEVNELSDESNTVISKTPTTITSMLSPKPAKSKFNIEHQNVENAIISSTSSENYVVVKQKIVAPSERDPLDISNVVDGGKITDDDDEGDIEIIEEDDDGWEDIEIVETAPSINSLNSNLVNKEASKTAKNKFNTLHKFSRLYASLATTSKSRKKLKPFKQISTDGDGSNVSDSIKIDTDSRGTSTSTPTSTSKGQSPITTTTQLLAFRPMVANLSDLLPDSPCNDPIELAPELAPSSPLQDLNDITTLLGTNLNGLMDMDVEAPTNSVCIHNTDNQQTSIQEALDYVNAQEDNFSIDVNTTQPMAPSTTTSTTANNSTGATATPVSINRIQNIGFNCIATSTETSGYKFYCYTERCTFLFSSEAIGLQNHFLFEHPQSRWNGFCNTCSNQVKSATDEQEFKISEEFNHMLDVHIKRQNEASKTATTAEEGVVVEHNDSDGLTQRETPRIKLRRLSGDCLSTMMASNDSRFDVDDSNSSFSDLIRFNSRAMTLSSEDAVAQPDITEPSIINDVPLFKNISKDFAITSISSGLEVSEISEIVNNVCKVPLTNVESNSPNTSTDVLPLHISNVVSLNNDSDITGLTSSPLKISNVCSLNANKQSSKNLLILPQQVRKDYVKVKPAPVKPRESGEILTNALRNTVIVNAAAQHRPDSPGPMVVAETLPVAQATAGDFVITQTVSAEYGEQATGDANGLSNVGFNISISAAAVQPHTPTAASPRVNSSPNTTPEPKSISKQNPLLKPILKCLEFGCKFETRHFVAMIDHIKMHERLSDPAQQEYLRCSICSLMAKSIDDYTQHVRVVHLGAASPAATPIVATKPSTVVTTVPTTPSPLSATPVPVAISATPAAPATTPTNQTACSLFEQIRNLLFKEGNTKKDNSANNAAADTLKKSEKNAFKEKLLETINEMVSKTGLSENLLYCCLVKDCNVKLTESTYHTHVLYHMTTTGAAKCVDGISSFACPHCGKKFQNLSRLKPHLKVHGRHNFFCYICMETAASASLISQHFAQKHWIKKELNATVLIKAENSNGQAITYYVAYVLSMSESEVHDFGKKLILEWQRKQAANRTHFYPNELDLLPLHAIFNKKIFCSLCLYKTKVRTNMVRHMTMHNSEVVEGSAGLGGANNLRKDGIASDLQTMIVANMDPVNPVPCLSSSERHFDRMTNLASSSLGTAIQQGGAGAAGGGTGTEGGGASATGIGCKLRYSYIPMTRRFTCGVPGCQYLTISEDIFRSHLNTLHCDIRSYKCIFCNENLCKRTLAVERILQHLRFHDRTLYQCEQCDHSHYIRYVVERHAVEKHGQVLRTKILMFVRSEDGEIEGTQKILGFHNKQAKDSNKGETTAEPVQSSKNAGDNVNANIPPASTPATQQKPSTQKLPKFTCDLCSHKTFTYNQIIAHCNAKHGIKHPFKCPYCISFTAWSEPHIKQHIDLNHHGKEFRVTQVFHKMNAEEQKRAQIEFLEQEQINTNEINTKPLWQRDDPLRRRQIRGIPMEDEEESERLSKRLRLCEDSDDNDDNEEAGVNGKLPGQSPPQLFLDRFEFGCFYCEYKTNNLDELRKTHWESAHNANPEVPSKPYLFRVLIRVRCPECRLFVGTGWELKHHYQNVHQKTNWIAADVRAKLLVCGFCDFQCASPTQLLRHHQREEHQLTDVKCLTAYQMAQIIRLEYTEPPKVITYMHCSLCSELFSSRHCLILHARKEHEDNTKHLSFREMTNTTIYRCSDCAYASTTEITTLRHMINHFRRFQRCNFCGEPQTTFNGYMQHCYSDHRTEIRRFSEIYPLSDIRKFLVQLLIIFPNGWAINKKNLRNTPYGSEERIKLLYAEICKTSQEPPIPRLSLGRLVARKSIEAKQQQMEASDASSTVAVMQLAGNSGDVGVHKQALNAQRISKRRSTIACSNDEMNASSKHQLPRGKKQKLFTHLPESRDNKLPATAARAPPPKFASPTPITMLPKELNKKTKLELEPYSYYGKRPDVEEWSKIYTKVSFAGVVNKPICLDKFKTFVNIDPCVKVEKLDITKLRMSSKEFETRLSDEKNELKHVRKACPASQKYRFT